MIVIVANGRNCLAHELAERWAPWDAAVLTAQDLSIAGWSLGDGADDRVVVDQRRISERDISAVLTLAPSIFEKDLGHIAVEDRSYVAAEMTATLTFWLSRLRCPVLNRPTASRLAGPAWTQEKWVRVAYQAGLPVQSVRQTSMPDEPAAELEAPSSPVTLTVIGDRVLGSDDLRLQQDARCLARAAAVELLAVRFTNAGCGPCFAGADVFPDLSADAVASAVLQYLRGQAT